MLSVSNKAQTAHSVPACKIFFKFRTINLGYLHTVHCNAGAWGGEVVKALRSGERFPVLSLEFQ